MRDLGAQLTEALKTILRVHKQSIHTAIPGRIVSFDKEMQRAAVEVAIQPWMKVEGGFEKLDAPLLPTVPVLFPRGGGSFITWPLRKGDYCLVIFQERSIDQWCAKGGTQVDPIWRWEHDLSDAVCIPGFYPYPEALEDLDTEAIALGFEEGSAKLRVKEDVVEVGGSAYAIALAEKVEAALETLKQAIAGAPVVATDGGASFKAGIMMALGMGAPDPDPPPPSEGPAWPPSLGATKAKAE